MGSGQQLKALGREYGQIGKTEPAFRDIFTDLREQEALGYHRRRTGGSWRKVRVPLAEPGLG